MSIANRQHAGSRRQRGNSQQPTDCRQQGVLTPSPRKSYAALTPLPCMATLSSHFGPLVPALSCYYTALTPSPCRRYSALTPLPRYDHTALTFAPRFDRTALTPTGTILKNLTTCHTRAYTPAQALTSHMLTRKFTHACTHTFAQYARASSSHLCYFQ
jgi:hypothetical protein